MRDVVLAVDLGGTNLRMASLLDDGTIVSQTRSPTPKGLTPAGLIDALKRLAGECKSSLDPNHRVIGISAGVPANIDDQGIVKNLPNIPLLSGMNLRESLSTEFRLPVTLENDATAAAIGENWLGASKLVKDSILITLGTGVGGGIIIDDRPLRGRDGTAGTIGHMCVEPEGVACKCGSRGCIEQYASATAIVRMAGEKGLQVSTAYDVYNARDEGDAKATAVFDAVGYYLGITIAGLLNALNPEMVVIGGGVAAGLDAFIEPLRTEIKARAFSEPVERAAIRQSELGDDAGIIGAARSAFLNA
jgi:glucokinase